MGKKKLETTYYRFMSEIRSFLSKLLKNPINAEPTKYLKDRNFNKTKIINVLIKREILERHEKIMDSTNSEEKDAKYIVKYKVKKKNFETKIHRIFIDYFENDDSDDNKVNENNEMVMPLISRPSYQEVIGKKRKKIEEMRKIYITESQFKHILECIVNPNAGDMMLNEDGEGGAAGATAGDIGQWGSGDTPVRTSGFGSKKKKNIGGFAFDEDFIGDNTTHSAKVTTLNMK